MHTMKLPNFSHQVWALFLFFLSRLATYFDWYIDTSVTWGVNLKQDNLSAAVLEATAIVNTFSSPSIKNAGIALEAVEIGNEPDYYAKDGARSRPYTVQQYVSECVLVFRSRGPRSTFTHMPPLWQMESVRCLNCINPTICKILGCVFCSVFAFY